MSQAESLLKRVLKFAPLFIVIGQTCEVEAGMVQPKLVFVHMDNVWVCSIIMQNLSLGKIQWDYWH